MPRVIIFTTDHLRGYRAQQVFSHPGHRSILRIADDVVVSVVFLPDCRIRAVVGEISSWYGEFKENEKPIMIFLDFDRDRWAGGSYSLESIESINRAGAHYVAVMNTQAVDSNRWVLRAYSVTSDLGELEKPRVSSFPTTAPKWNDALGSQWKRQIPTSSFSRDYEAAYHAMRNRDAQCLEAFNKIRQHFRKPSTDAAAMSLGTLYGERKEPLTDDEQPLFEVTARVTPQAHHDDTSIGISKVWRPDANPNEYLATRTNDTKED